MNSKTKHFNNKKASSKIFTNAVQNATTFWIVKLLLIYFTNVSYSRLPLGIWFCSRAIQTSTSVSYCAFYFSTRNFFVFPPFALFPFPPCNRIKWPKNHDPLASCCQQMVFLKFCGQLFDRVLWHNSAIENHFIELEKFFFIDSTDKKLLSEVKLFKLGCFRTSNCLYDFYRRL